MKHFISGTRVAVDTETTGLEVWHGDQPFAVSFCNTDGDTHYFEWPVDPWTRTVLPVISELEQTVEFLLDRRIRKVFHNAKYDIRMLETMSIEHLGVELFDRQRRQLLFPIDETTFMAWCCNGMEPNYKLKRLAWQYLQYPRDDETDLQKLVNRLRRLGKKEGWMIGYKPKHKEDGSIEQESVTQADYWLPQAAWNHGHRDWLGRKEASAAEEAKYCQKYAVGDAERTILLAMFYDEIMEDEGVAATYDEEIEELWNITYAMEERGICLLRDVCEKEEANSLKELHQYKQLVVDEAWPEFKGTPAELQILLYNKNYLGLEAKVRTPKTGLPATNIEALEAHSMNPTVKNIQKWRAAHKAWSTFFGRYNRLAVHDLEPEGEWAIHTDFRQIGPVTGRYSSATPNLQNVANAITSRSVEPIQARTVFGPRVDHAWYHWDYQQLEVRIFADVAQEQFMLQAIRDGKDLHGECANKAWGGMTDKSIKAVIHALELDGSGPPPERKPPAVLSVWKDAGIRPGKLHRLGLTDKERIAEAWYEPFDGDIVKAEGTLKKKSSRGRAKMLLFLKVFGGGANAAATLIGCPYDEALEFLNDYNTSFPRIPEYSREIAAEGRANGYVYDCFGTKLTVNRDKAYQGVNRIVQGSAARLLKQSMVKCNRYLLEIALRIHMVLTIHDELVFEAWKNHAKRSVIIRLGQIMADHEGRFGVATPVELERVTTSWNEKKPVEWCKDPVYPLGYKEN